MGSGVPFEIHQVIETVIIQSQLSMVHIHSRALFIAFPSRKKGYLITLFPGAND